MRILSAFLFLSISPLADAACGLSVVASDLNFDWDFTFTAPAISITVSKTNPAACTFGLAFTKGGSASYVRRATNGGAELKYQLYQDNGLSKILKDAPDITSVNDVVMYTLPAGSNPQVAQYYFDIPYATATSPLIVAAGIYTDSYTINAYEGADPTLFASPPDASAAVNVALTVPKMVSLSLVDTGGSFLESATTKSIHFGNLAAGQVSRFDMRVRTNAGYSVTVASTNGGKMKHSTQNIYVPYGLYVNNVLSDPTGVVPVLTGSGQSSMSGLGYPVKIVVGTVGSLALSGTYSDTVVITATATD